MEPIRQQKKPADTEGERRIICHGDEHTPRSIDHCLDRTNVHYPEVGSPNVEILFDQGSFYGEIDRKAAFMKEKLKNIRKEERRRQSKLNDLTEMPEASECNSDGFFEFAGSWLNLEEGAKRAQKPPFIPLSVTPRLGKVPTDVIPNTMLQETLSRHEQRYAEFLNEVRRDEIPNLMLWALTPDMQNVLKLESIGLNE